MSLFGNAKFAKIILAISVTTVVILVGRKSCIARCVRCWVEARLDCPAIEPIFCYWWSNTNRRTCESHSGKIAYTISACGRVQTSGYWSCYNHPSVKQPCYATYRCKWYTEGFRPHCGSNDATWEDHYIPYIVLSDPGCP